MIKIKTFENKDYLAIRPKDFYLKDELIERRDMGAVTSEGPKNTFYDSETGEILAIAGVQIFWGGVAEVWTITSRYADKYSVGFARAIKECMEFYIKSLDLRRLQATCPKSMPCGDRWFKFLGFEKEGLMKNFGPEGEDYYLFARVK